MVLLVASMGGQPEAPLRHMTAGKDAGIGRVMTFHSVRHYPCFIQLHELLFRTFVQHPHSLCLVRQSTKMKPQSLSCLPGLRFCPDGLLALNGDCQELKVVIDGHYQADIIWLEGCMLLLHQV